ncbi:MAG: acetyl-CoA C-acyltransferase [Gammaproteobacteria bacterium]|nr:acetyl-CoA C-acyltransferase [Gammaproteobacteria bacterium]
MSGNKKNSNDDDNAIVIVAARRTPMGSLLGSLSTVTAPQLGSQVIKAVLEDSQVEPATIDEVFMGCVLPAGVGQAPARQAALLAGVPSSTGCTTINKVCGSAMKAIMLGHDLITAGSARRVIAGGMESMSNAPYLLPKARNGLRLGHSEVIDHMFFDGLENASDNLLMGHFAERCVDQYAFSREEQDAFAIESVLRARRATAEQQFAEEIVPVPVTSKNGQQLVTEDEQPGKSNPDKVPQLKPAFRKEGGSVTAANSSSISDGAAAVLLMRAADARQNNIAPLAKIIAHASYAQAPEDFTTAPIGAITRLKEKTGWRENDIDLYEINEAFAVVTMAAMRDLKLDHNKVNVNGGACALGHPIGATGARLVVTLLHALRQRGLKRGIAALCIGGGEATAIAIEII